MITDEEFSALIAEAAEAIPEPTGADAILAAARVEIDSPSVASPIAKARRHPRGFAISALGAAAVLAIVIAVAVSSSSSPPSIARRALSPSALGLGGAPALRRLQAMAGVTNSNDHVFGQQHRSRQARRRSSPPARSRSSSTRVRSVTSSPSCRRSRRRWAGTSRPPMWPSPARVVVAPWCSVFPLENSKKR